MSGETFHADAQASSNPVPLPSMRACFPVQSQPRAHPHTSPRHNSGSSHTAFMFAPGVASSHSDSGRAVRYDALIDPRVVVARLGPARLATLVL